MSENATPRSEIVAAAQTIRSELPRLLGSDLAAQVESQLVDLLVQTETAPREDDLADVEDRILELLAAYPPTRERMDELLPVVDEERGFEPLPGGGGPVDVEWYTCPREKNHYDWPVLDVEEPIPECPVHHVVLVPKPSS
jgi:hypothetical protein